MDEYIKITILENEIEAMLLVSVLKERDIPYRLQSYHDTAYDGLFQTQKGWGAIMAPESFRKEIDDILSSLREQAEKPEEKP